MAEYWRKKDVLKAMEDNSHMVDVFGCKKKMIDGMMLCWDLSALEVEEFPSDEELEEELANGDDCGPTW